MPTEQEFLRARTAFEQAGADLDVLLDEANAVISTEPMFLGLVTATTNVEVTRLNSRASSVSRRCAAGAGLMGLRAERVAEWRLVEVEYRAAIERYRSDLAAYDAQLVDLAAVADGPIVMPMDAPVAPVAPPPIPYWADLGLEPRR